MADDIKPNPKAVRNDLTAEFVRSILHYDPQTGLFFWRYAAKGHDANTQAGHVDKKTGRVHIRIGPRSENHLYLAHRLAWLYMTGNWPARQVDHRDLNPTNNVWTNLREADNVQNNHNKPAPARNRTGHKGVIRRHGKPGFEVRVYINRNVIIVGYFKTIPQAVAARDAFIATSEIADFYRP